MDKSLLEQLKGMSREERTAYFNEHKSELMEESLSCVNGGAGASNNENPNSEVPYKGNYYTSWGFVCNGSHFCG
ncbi:MAG: hypothetical protein IJ136_08285 [Erysipelotrichaceae bacterium]|nr:hypothetical protein [Erysipelotrichaceae bacterium]